MPDTETEISILKIKVAGLEQRLEKLLLEHKKGIHSFVRADDVLHNHRRVITAELADAFDRIIKLELMMYPRLVRDMDHLHAVIGDREAKAYNPLDFRDPTKKPT